MQKFLSLAFLMLLASLTGKTQPSPIGAWKTVDDKTCEPKSHVEIYTQNGMLYGKITKLLRSDPDTVCDKCPGDKKDKPLLGMVILQNLKSYKDYWRKGDILDPESGNEYGCSIWFENGNKNELMVRGKHWSGLYRTQTWYRVE